MWLLATDCRIGVTPALVQLGLTRKSVPTLSLGERWPDGTARFPCGRPQRVKDEGKTMIWVILMKKDNSLIDCKGLSCQQSIQVLTRFRHLGRTNSKPDSTKDLQCMWAWCTLNLTSWGKRSPYVVERNLGEESLILRYF
ncbi:hypothetical protein AVEN_243713-1 [Araneus ventricosus]|uniref:Uncharacterized protein n=1 Tax=Araneus ventricosus TaxID=182803 RepID=A0A4Y2A5B5_ARAVE|nr:hypothetical protein AVEN_243713-1 [Araneus ventricosus]